MGQHFTGVKITSDFSDYYDYLSNDGSSIVYDRKEKDRQSRGKDLAFLRSLGIRTIEIKQPKDWIGSGEQLVVYKNPRLHHGEGKIITSIDDALLMYGNYPATLLLKPDDGLTCKYLQLGKRRFTMYFQSKEPLKIGELISINETSLQFNESIKFPIFSIDYLMVGGQMLATDFNTVENLKEIGLDKYLKPEEVLIEIERYFREV